MFRVPLREITAWTAASQFAADSLRVVLLVAQKALRPPSGPTGSSGDGRDAVDEVERLGGIVDMVGGCDDVQRGVLAVADEVMPAARLPPADRRRTGRGSPFFARTWELSTHALVQSSSPIALSSASRVRCNRS
jgi:hypothetical protein